MKTESSSGELVAGILLLLFGGMAWGIGAAVNSVLVIGFGALFMVAGIGLVVKLLDRFLG